MKCNLCGNDRELKNSHIIPEWVYTDLYDEKHRFNVLATTKIKPRPLEQKGIREKLLCNDCEQKFSKYEKYAREVIRGGESVLVQKYQNKILVSDINYTLFKLFQISVLWRAGISNNEMFSKVDLGPHENTLRNMLIVEDPGSSNKYGCLMFGIINENDVVSDFIDQPEELRIDGMRCYRFVFSGFVWVFFVASHSPNTNAKSFMISEKGVITICIRQFKELEYLKRFAKNIHKMRSK